MQNERAVLVTDNIHDYALAVSSHKMIAQNEGWEACYPVQVPPKALQQFEQFAAYYKTKIIRFAELVDGADPLSRSETLRRRFSNGCPAITVKVGSGMTALLHCVVSSMRHQLPIVWTESNSETAAQVAWSDGNSALDHLVFVAANSLLSVAAALYADVSGKKLVLLDRAEDILTSPHLATASSAILVAEPKALNKEFLEEFAELGTTAHVSVLTAYSPETFTCLVWRTLEYRDFRRAGKSSALLDNPTDIDLHRKDPVEHLIISDHGNEAHMHYGHKVLCGAIAPEYRSGAQRDFSCEWGCPHDNRHLASQVAAHHLAILSCSTFTLADGLVPSDFSLLLNFLNGWPISAISPYRHAMAVPRHAILLEALLRSGFSLGEMTSLLNGIASFGTLADKPYILLGDPETRLSAEPAVKPVVQVAESDGLLELEFSQVSGRIVTTKLPPAFVETLLATKGRPAVSAWSDNTKRKGIYFTFASTPTSGIATELVLFSNSDLPVRFSVHVAAARTVTAEERDSVVEWLPKIRRQRVFGTDPSFLATLEDSLLQTLRHYDTYPALIENVYTAGTNDVPTSLHRRLRKLRETLLLELSARSAERLWLSHHYAGHYSRMQHLAEEDTPRRCHTCGNNVHIVRYEEDSSALPSRDLLMCSRCGIVADQPAQPEIGLRLSPSSPVGSSHRQKITVTNLTQRRIDVSLTLQFHLWERLGIESENEVFEFTLEPGGSAEEDVTFRFRRPLPDYIHDLMAYAVTDRLDLYNAAMRIVTQQNGFFPAHIQSGNQHDHHQHDHHHQHHGHHEHPALAVLHKQDADKSRFVAVLEPHAALYRYFQIIQKRFKVLVLTTNPARCLRKERLFNLSMGEPIRTRVDRFVECDTTSVDAMLQALEPYKDQLAGVLAGDDCFVSVTADLGCRMGFDYANREAAESQHIKTFMKQRFLAGGVPTPRFYITRTFEEAQKAWNALGRDCMVKMVDASSSINIFRVSTMQQLRDAWDTIIDNKQELKTLFDLSKEVIVEEFVSGRELTVEGYVQDDDVVCLNFTEKLTAANFVVVGHYLPAQVSAKEADILRKVARQCAQAVGMRNTVFHIEVHISGDDPYVIECASRPPGLHTVELIFRAYGFDLMDISVALAIGEKVTEKPRTPQKYFGILSLYSEVGGVLNHIAGVEELKQRGGVAHLRFDVKPGDRIEPLSSLHQKDGFVILEDPTPEGAREKAAWARSLIQFVLEPEVKPIESMVEMVPQP